MAELRGLRTSLRVLQETASGAAKVHYDELLDWPTVSVASVRQLAARLTKLAASGGPGSVSIEDRDAIVELVDRLPLGVD